MNSVDAVNNKTETVSIKMLSTMTTQSDKEYYYSAIKQALNEK